MFPVFFVFPFYLAVVLTDAAMFFLVVRLLRRVFPARPLEFLDRIGSAGVDVVTAAIAQHLRRWWKRPLSPRQEEAAALLVLMAARLLFTSIFRV